MLNEMGFPKNQDIKECLKRIRLVDQQIIITGHGTSPYLEQSHLEYIFQHTATDITFKDYII